MTHQSDSQDLMVRVEKLERQARRLKGGIVALALVGGSALLMGQSNPNRTVTASRLVITDSQGRARIMLVADAQGPSISIADADGAPLAGMEQDSHGGMLVLWDARSKASAHLDASEGASALNLYGPGGKDGMFLDASNLGAGLKISDAGGNNTMSFDTTAAGLSAELTSGKNNAKMEATADGPSLELKDGDGFSATLGHAALVTTRTGEKHETSAASIVLFGKDKKALWSAP